MDKEKSAIDAIYQLLELIQNLDQKMDVMDQNIKLINNKLNALQDGKPQRAVGKPKAVSPVSMPSTPQATAVNQEPGKLVLGNIKTFGYIRKKKGQNFIPLENVLVNIYNNKSELIKNIPSDKEGYWEARLPPGKYGVEYIHKDFKPINKVISLDQTISKYEVK